MHKEMKKSILYISISAIVLILLLYIAVLFLPMHKPVKQVKIDPIQLKDTAINKCIGLCFSHKDDINYSNGPCLSDKYDFKVDGWVCDIAHKPRLEIDNSNKCKEFPKDKNHFVEVNENCGLIRAE